MLEAIPDQGGKHGLRYDLSFLLTCLIAALRMSTVIAGAPGGTLIPSRSRTRDRCAAGSIRLRPTPVWIFSRNARRARSRPRPLLFGTQRSRLPREVLRFPGLSPALIVGWQRQQRTLKHAIPGTRAFHWLSSPSSRSFPLASGPSCSSRMSWTGGQTRSHTCLRSRFQRSITLSTVPE